MSTQSLTDSQARELVVEAVQRIVPDADFDAIGDDTPLRAEFELDSLDFLSFAETLAQRSGVAITEDDYGRLLTMRSCIDLLAGG
jgi:acyl carrier protein